MKFRKSIFIKLDSWIDINIRTIVNNFFKNKGLLKSYNEGNIMNRILVYAIVT
jgi:hypothetical protein